MTRRTPASPPDVHPDGPDELIEEFIDQVPVGRVLDLGMGEGRNALWLAGLGFDVVGVDVSPVAVETARRQAGERGIALDVRVADIRELEIEAGGWVLIVAAAVLHFLAPAEAQVVAARIKAGLRAGGLVIAHVFTVDDPGFAALQAEGVTCVARNTFALPELGSPLHYFEPGELHSLFEDLEILYYAEERHLDTSQVEPHYHAGAFLVARKPAASYRDWPSPLGLTT